MQYILPFLQDDADSADQRLLEQQWQIRSRENSFRALLGRATTVLLFLASSSIVFYLLPFYPPAMAIFLAIIVAVFSYRWPSIALGIMLFFTAPAYSYQLGGEFWALGVFMAIAAVLPFCVAHLPGAILGCALGTAAAVLMLTSSFILALPLLAGVTLLRMEGSRAAGGWALFMFLTIYIPFLFMLQVPLPEGEAVPLFTTVDYPRQPHLSNLDLTSLKNAFQQQSSNGMGGFPGASSYFVEGWGGVVLLLSITMAIGVIPLILRLTERIDESRIFLRAWSPIITLLTISLVFLLPMQLLESPLGYETGFHNWDNIGIFIGIMLGMGIFGFLLEFWFGRRNIKVRLRGDLAYLSVEIYHLLDSTRRRLKEIASACHNRAFNDETAAISQCEEKVALTLESEGAFGLPRLELGCSEFETMRSQLVDVQIQLENKLVDHLEESRSTYKATFDRALALGIPALQDVTQTMPLTSENADYQNALTEQVTLNNALRDLATKLVAAGDMLAKTIKDEVDPEFSLTTIDIGHGFLEQGRFAEAARTISEDLQIIDGRIEHSIVDLAGRVSSAAKDLIKVITSRLIPTFESIGDADSLGRYNSMIDEMKEAANSVQGSRTLADMIKIVEQGRKLSETAISIVKELRGKIDAIADANDRRCPSRYSWGRNTHSASESDPFLEMVKSTTSEITISKRFEIIDKAVKTIDQQAKVITQYSQASEFLVNYPNIEYILQEKLRTNGGIASSDLPVKQKYAVEYLKMFAALNYKEVTFDSKEGVVKHGADNHSNNGETGE